MSNSPLEKVIVGQIVRALKANGVTWCVKTHGGPYQVSGIPDILSIAPVTGRLLGIEVKRPVVGKLTALQAAQLAKIEAAGGVAGVATSVDEALELLKKANEGAKEDERSKGIF